MRKLAFAFTQLHLLNLLNLRISTYKNDEMDLIAYSPSGSGALEILQRIKKIGIFNRVLILENYYPQAKGINKAYYRLKELAVAAINKGKIRRYVKEYEYDEFLSYGSNMEAYIAYSEISKKRKLPFIVYEEGIGTYVEKITYALKPWHTMMLKLLGVRIPVLPDVLLVYVPELIVTDIPSSIRIDKIPKLKCKELINEVWNYKSSDQLNQYSTICFEQPVKNNVFQSELFQCFDKSTSVVKMHPRSLFVELYKCMNVMEKTGVIWEVECMNGNLEEKRLVSLFSTACMTPKMMFDDEPEVIFLEQLLPGEFDDKMFKELIKRFQSIYSDCNKVKVPQSTEELEIIAKGNIID